MGELSAPLFMQLRKDTTDYSIVQEVQKQDVYGCYDLDLGSGSVVFDVGGHIGSFSVMLGVMGAEVYTYEPVRVNFEMLQANIEHNNLEDRVHIHRMGILNTSGKRKIAVREINFGGSNFYQKGRRMEEVRTTTLAREFEKYDIQRCDFLKLDCEDAEYDVIRNFPYMDRIQRLAAEVVGKQRMDEMLSVISRAKMKFRTVGPGANKIGFIHAWRD